MSARLGSLVIPAKRPLETDGDISSKKARIDRDTDTGSLADDNYEGPEEYSPAGEEVPPGSGYQNSDVIAVSHQRVLVDCEALTTACNVESPNNNPLSLSIPSSSKPARDVLSSRRSRHPRTKPAVATQRNHSLILRNEPEPAISGSSERSSIIGHQQHSMLETSEDHNGPATSAMAPPAPIIQTFDTYPDAFGVWRRYYGYPSQSIKEIRLVMPPPAMPPILSLDNDKRSEGDTKTTQILSRSEAIAPFPTWSSWLLAQWFWKATTTQKSLGELDSLVRLLSNPEFRSKDVAGVNFRRIKDSMGNSVVPPLDAMTEEPIHGTGWKHHVVTIYLPDGGAPEAHNGGADRAKGKGKRKQTSAVNGPAPLNRESNSRVDSVRPEDSGSGHKSPPSKGIPYHVEGCWKRSLTSLATEYLTSSTSREHTLDPFEQYYQPDPSKAPQRVYDNAFTSDAVLEEHRHLQSLPRKSGDGDIPYRILPIMLWSDATQLTDIGQSQLHPVYAAFSSQCKWERCEPGSRTLRHVAYMPKLSEGIKDFLEDVCKRHPTSTLLTHCRRELFQALMDAILLDEEFIRACHEGILIQCSDGILRRIFLRLMTYSADYPERVMLATVRNLGKAPCPICEVKLSETCQLGTEWDRQVREHQQRCDSVEWRRSVKSARKDIYDEGYVPTSTRVDNKLAAKSWVPTENVFLKAFRNLKLSYDLFRMLVVDLMHEFELGVWKMVLIHILRILLGLDAALLRKLNERYHAISSFGKGVIRKFPENVADLKGMTAHDYEDLLQCAIPVVCGLLRAHDEKYREDEDTILDLLYQLATWHALAKLRIHTSDTLKFLDHATTSLGATLRRFRDTVCPHFRAQELPTLDAQKRTSRPPTAPEHHPPQTSGTQKRKKKKPFVFSLNTFKMHSLGDYVKCIQRHGTTDGYSTQPGEAEHKICKLMFPRTRMQRDTFTREMTKMDSLGGHMRQIECQLEDREAGLKATHQADDGSDLESESDSEDSITTTFERSMKEYHIGVSRKKVKHLPVWVKENQNDPAFEKFIPQLKNHLLQRHYQRKSITRIDDDTVYPAEKHSDLVILSNRVYLHSTARINYTSYDLRRDYDSITPTHRDVMLLSNEDTEDDSSDTQQFWYGRVHLIFHLDIVIPDRKTNTAGSPQRMDVMLIRWFGADPTGTGGAVSQRLQRIGYVPGAEYGFGFIDPRDIIRGCHLIPGFFEGVTNELLSPSTFSDNIGGPGFDWKYYYVNHWVDRDMMMRYCGGGVGHLGTTCASSAIPLVVLPEPPATATQRPVHVTNPADYAEGSSSSEEEDENDDDYVQDGSAEDDGLTAYDPYSYHY